MPDMHSPPSPCSFPLSLNIEQVRTSVEACLADTALGKRNCRCSKEFQRAHVKHIRKPLPRTWLIIGRGHRAMKCIRTNP